MMAIVMMMMTTTTKVIMSKIFTSRHTVRETTKSRMSLIRIQAFKQSLTKKDVASSLWSK